MQEAMQNAKYVGLLSGHATFDSVSRAGSTHRAWQELPRHLRRRAASHNVRRVPLRLRNRSRAEVRSVSLSPYMILGLISTPRWTHYVEKSSGDHFRNEARTNVSPVVMYFHGDRVRPTFWRIFILSTVHMTPGDKKWLETHLWHTKRMHMENMWGYRLVGTCCRAPSR
jgi:ribonuclease P/MRP protein subunit POP1